MKIYRFMLLGATIISLIILLSGCKSINSGKTLLQEYQSSKKERNEQNNQEIQHLKQLKKQVNEIYISPTHNELKGTIKLSDITDIEGKVMRIDKTNKDSSFEVLSSISNILTDTKHARCILQQWTRCQKNNSEQ